MAESEKRIKCMMEEEDRRFMEIMKEVLDYCPCESMEAVVETIEKWEVRPNRRQALQILQMLEEPSEPNEALKKLMRIKNNG